jgi:hypothetical protein
MHNTVVALEYSIKIGHQNQAENKEMTFSQELLDKLA